MIIIGLLCALVAIAFPVSRQKGNMRLAASSLVGTGFVIGAVAQIGSGGAMWPAIFGVVAGIFLDYVGWRKYRRDPEGRTRPAKML